MAGWSGELNFSEAIAPRWKEGRRFGRLGANGFLKVLPYGVDGIFRDATD